MTVTGAATPNPVGVGKTLTYTLAVSFVARPRSAAPQQVTLTDKLDSKVVYVGAQSSQGSCTRPDATGLISCPLGAVALGSVVRVVVTVTAPAAVGQVTNTAQVSAPYEASRLSDRTILKTVVGSNSDLAIAKTVAPAAVGPGASITEQLTVTNNGPDATGGAVHVNDVLPPGVAFGSVSVTTPPGVSAQCAGPSGSDVSTVRLVICQLAPLPPHATVTLTVVAAVQAAPQGGPDVDTATVRGDLVADPIPANNVASAGVSCAGCPLPPSGQIANVTALHAPIVTVVSDPLTLTASVYDTQWNPRPTQTVQIFLTGNPSAGPPAQPVATCRFASSCTYTDTTGVTSQPGTFAYRAVAFDDLGGRAESPWKLVDVVKASDVGPFPPSLLLVRVIRIGVVTPAAAFGTTAFDQAADIAFFPGTGFDITTPAGRQSFSSAMTADLLGLLSPSLYADCRAGPCVFFGPKTAGSFFANQDAVSFWLVPLPVTVTASDPANPDPMKNLCNIGPISVPVFAEANGVVHTVNCHDDAPGNLFTASGPLTVWHELHHALLGLADEHSEGGYWQPDPFPNLYYWPDDCNRDPLSGDACTPVRSGGETFNPWQWTRWWRVDSNPHDVMVDNTYDQPAETRRATWYFGQCRSAQC